LRRPGKLAEKWLLRRAFESTELLPYDVLWRKKEAFSDGVSGLEKSWYEITQEMSAAAVGDMWVGKAETPEKYYYKKLYENIYGAAAGHANVPYLWMPKWSPGATDPSARTLAVYK
jgi:asparagine synthase (glutamine-hydrolysing)